MGAATIYRIFGQQVATERIARGLTQAGLGELVGLSRASIANIEAGRQRVLLHQAVEIVGALDAGALSGFFPDVRITEDTPAVAGSIAFSGSGLSKGEAKRLAQIVAKA